MKSTLFYEMFPFLIENEQLESGYNEAKVLEAVVNRQNAAMELRILLPAPVPPLEIRTIEHIIARQYGLASVTITASFEQASPSESSGKKSVDKSAAVGTVIMGKAINKKAIPISEVTLDLGKVIVKGEVCDISSKYIEKRNSWDISFDVTDYSGTIHVSKLIWGNSDNSAVKIAKSITMGMPLIVSGDLAFNKFYGDMVLEPQNIVVSEKTPRVDSQEKKRVELHLHTQMSSMDAVTPVADAISRAIQWGHPAIAITDHGVVHSFPEAEKAQREQAKLGNEIKVIYGLEAYYNSETSYPYANHTDENPSAQTNYDELMAVKQKKKKKKRLRYRHIILLAKNQIGIRNLYKLVTKSHLEDFDRFPVIRKCVLQEHREGLIVGSACEAGELFTAVSRKAPIEELRDIASFYDYLEIQPISNNMFMLYGENPLANDENDLRAFNTTVYTLGKELNIPVVATGDVHFLDSHHEVFRKILQMSKGYNSSSEELPLHYRTTAEMLEEFSYLGKDEAYEVVVENSVKIADMCEFVSPLPPPKTLFPPKIEGSAALLKTLVYDNLKKLYGDNPPEIVTSRLEAELSDILGRNYDVIYIAAQKLVKNSLDHGYLVGSRGSVGSSLVAFLSGITEVNALPAHYRCPNCCNSDFESGADSGCGADMKDAICPKCDTLYHKDGFNIPFETFLGFGGDKVPDIDLNFSGEFQAQAHRQAIELFGSDNVYRAGTIGSVAEKTAFGYVKNYLEKIGKTTSRAEEKRLAKGCIGVKRTTGQHPGGLIIIPQGMHVTDFCPAQHPADSKDAGIVTTHFDYGCMEDNLIKLDALGHDDPTMIRMLEDLTGVNATEIKLDDPETMSIFTSPRALDLPDDDDIIGTTGAIGIPEFGTSFTRQMLGDTQPKNFDTLVRLSGYSHGTDVWLGNAKDLILAKDNNITVRDTISCRDDIMLFLISKGMEAKKAFQVSESVRKGNGLPDGKAKEMADLGVPAWYIDSAQKIKYLFPKAHAVAYVMMAFRIAWFKVHRPLAFYSAYFYRRSQKDSFDVGCMTRGINIAKAKIREIKNNPDSKAKDEDLLVTLEVCYEFYMRGFEFASIDIFKSDPTKFLLINENTLLPPLISISGLGETAANDIAEKRGSAEFVSIDDFAAACSKVSKTHLEQLKNLGAFGEMPQSGQLSLF